MAKELLSPKTLEDILQRTRTALEEGRSQIFDVAGGPSECTRTEVVLRLCRRKWRRP